MSEPMVPRTKMILMNLAVAVAILYRWLHGAPTVALVITGLIMFPLINIVMIFAAKKSASNNQ